MNTRQTAKRYYLLALIPLVVGMVISGCNSAAIATPPDPASFLLSNGFTKDTADEATYSFPDNPCKAYINSIDHLTVLVYADNRIIIYIKEDQAQINEQSNLLQKVLTFLYAPDLVLAVMKPFTFPSGEIRAMKGDGIVGNYYWAVDDFGFPNESIDIAVMPKTPVFKSSKDPFEVLQNAGFVRDPSDDMSASGNISAYKAYINSDLLVFAILTDDGRIGIGIIRDPNHADFYFFLKQIAFEKGLINALYPAEISSQILSTIDTTGTGYVSGEIAKGNLTWAITPYSTCDFSVCPSNSGVIELWVYPSP
jgi:hypothetical protein